MNKRIEILAGYEIDLNKDGKPDVRVTPVHVPVDVPAIVADVLIGLIVMADAFDEQPHDGELDFDVSPSWLRKLGVKDLPEDAGNVFLRIRVQKA